MRQKSLFRPEQRLEPLSVDPRRAEPVVWVRRLIILSRPSVKALVQNIPFHRGLNVIRTEKRSPNDSVPVAHDVGKTLLMRLLRFTLGEGGFGSKEEMVRVRKAMPEGVVIAEWVIAGQEWVVVRPLSDEDHQQSFAVAGQSWDTAIKANDTDRIPMDRFVERIQDAAFSELPALHLKGERAGWGDALAWIARDCECGFRKADTWREREVNPQGFRDQKFNKIIMQWLMGLLSEPVAVARAAVEESKKKLKEAESHLQRKQERLQTLVISLAQSAGFDTPQIEPKSMPPALSDVASALCDFIKNQASTTTSQAAKFAKASKEEIETLRLRESQLEDHKTGAVRDAGEARIRHSIFVRLLKDEQQRETGPKNCPAKEQCAWLVEIQKNEAAGRMKSEDQHLDRLKDEIKEAARTAKDAEEKEKRLTEQYEKAKSDLAAKEVDLKQRETLMHNQRVRWLTFEERIEEVFIAADEMIQASESVQATKVQISDHRRAVDQQEHHEQRTRLRALSNIYTHVLTHIFDEDAEGDVRIDNGLTPTTIASLGAHGAALSAMARVLSFEVACVLASMCSVGCHPRLLLHDGPREGEMEIELFRLLFQTSHWLETLSPESDAAFQYIVTTASAPEEYSAQHPSVVLTLHGRSEDGLLLGKRF